MFNRVGYAPMALQYHVVMEELRSYKTPLATRGQDDDP